ncbi:MAG TPA: aminotransferase class I/II-fold pyridoxal phosphate-dependent enzyme, partial [Tepidisphaeraceae bacterium]
MSETLNQLALRLLEQKQHKHLLRARCAVEPIDATHVRIDGKRYINFASNDYLGLSHHPRMVEMLQKVASVGAGAAPLITGYSSVHAAAEADLAKWKKTESALLLPSGYQANTAAVQTLAALCEAMGRPVRFLVDKLAHASLIDAVRASGVAMRVFPHNGVAKLDRLLTDAASGELQVVVTESIFSMDGDAADLAALAQLKQRHDFVLLLDEAHGSGVYGRDGAGYASEAGFDTLTDITIVTLSKALGLSGGAICSSRAFIGAVENLGRAYIFSTA